MMSELQNNEKKAHQTLWKKRESLQKQQLDAVINIKSEIDAIMQEQSRILETESVERSKVIENTRDGNGKGHPPTATDAS